MTSPTLPVETDRLVLRLFESGDLDEVIAYYSLPDVQRYIDWPARDKGEVREALEEMSGQVALNRPGDTLSLAIVRREERALIGQVSLRWHDATAAQAEVRFAINPRHRGQGFATEAARAALTMGFEEFGFHRIFARCDARNQASARLLKGLGMRLEAHYREHALFQGEWDEELHFAILDREWARSPDISDFGMHRVA
jgi:RimJ/RimL family protein N-acetyltransferase